MSKILVQKLNLTCESQIEKAYFNNEKDKRTLVTDPVCVHCGEMDSTDGTFLLCQDQLSDLCLTNGYRCLPICVDCHKNKKKIITVGKKDAAKARGEKNRAAANKA